MTFYDKATSISKKSNSPIQENLKYKKTELELKLNRIKKHPKLYYNIKDVKFNEINFPSDKYFFSIKTDINQNENKTNNKFKMIYKRNKKPSIVKNIYSLGNFNNNLGEENLTDNNDLSPKNKRENMRNFFQNYTKLNKRILLFETEKYLLMEEPKDKIQNFILKTYYNPSKIYNIVKINNKYKKLFNNNKTIFNRNNIKNKIRNKTFNGERNISKEKIFPQNPNNHLSSLKTQRLNNYNLNIGNFANIPKMRISKNVFLNMHPINLRIFLK